MVSAFFKKPGVYLTQPFAERAPHPQRLEHMSRLLLGDSPKSFPVRMSERAAGVKENGARSVNKGMKTRRQFPRLIGGVNAFVHKGRGLLASLFSINSLITLET